MPSIQNRIEELEWKSLENDLFSRGYALTPPVLTTAECNELVTLYGRDEHFRSHIIMSRYRFGFGDYKYFTHPLPQVIQDLREHFYPPLVNMANRWNEALGAEQRFPASHPELLKLCHAHGQTRPTPLLLHYETGDYNCLHQDVYGDIVFPLQIACFLSQKGRDYQGGDFVLVEQQPRAQSKAEVISPDQGQAIIFTTQYRPVKGSRGYYRVNVRHGVSRVHSGVRYTLGVIFHDAA